MPKLILLIALVLLIAFFMMMTALYFYQDRLIFFPENLPPDHKFRFNGNFEELNFETRKGININAVLFNTDSARGLIYYLHGNAGSINTWGSLAGDFTRLGYDVLMIDYRGYGKSTGTITSEYMVHRDANFIYKQMKERYQEAQIILYGRSLGSGIAAKLAAKHDPAMLILETPYYNFPDVVNHHYRIIPTTFILKYKFLTNKYLKNVTCPVFLIHGTDDQIIPYDSSTRLAGIGDHIRLITIEGGNHNNLAEFEFYQDQLREILN